MTPQGTIVGVVPLEGRGSLPFVDLHQEPLFVHAVRALLAVDPVAGRVVVTVEPGQKDAAVVALERADLPALVQDAPTWWEGLSGGIELVLHDPLCPLAPASFIAACLLQADTEVGSLVAFRPVTDTLKSVVEDHVVDTLDRDRFGIVASPVVFRHRRTDTAPDRPVPPTDDFASLAAWLRERGPVRLHEAPSLGRRVDDTSAVTLLECLDELAQGVRET